MSLHALAGHMASKGRGTDSMLVHMTPEEVQSLQVLALKGGGTLTINPDTGLPEANFLKKMLPMIAGVALGPAGFGLMSAGMAGATVGGITALATGSLSRGLMAGLGAYGGAGLGAGLANMGSSAVGADALAAANASADPIMALTAAKDMATATGAAAPTGFSALAEGAKAAFNDPSSFVQSMGGMGKLAQTGLMATSPIMADKGVQTATPQQSTGMISNYTFDPYGQTYTSAGDYPASEYGGMAHGGIVALAAGGTSYRDLTKDSTADQVAAAYKQFTAGAGGDTQENQAAALSFLGNLGIGQDTINQAYNSFQASPTFNTFTNDEIGGYLKANPNADIAAATQQFNADPRAVNQYISQIGEGFLDPTQTTQGSGSGQYFDAFRDAGIDANELFSANRALNPDYTFGGDAGVGALQRAFDVAGQFDTYDYDSTAGDQLAKDTAFMNQFNAGNFGGDTATQINDIARLTGLSTDEIAGRFTAVQNAGAGAGAGARKAAEDAAARKAAEAQAQATRDKAAAEKAAEDAAAEKAAEDAAARKAAEDAAARKAAEDAAARKAAEDAADKAAADAAEKAIRDGATLKQALAAAAAAREAAEKAAAAAAAKAKAEADAIAKAAADKAAADKAAAANRITSTGVVNLNTNTDVTQDGTDNTVTGINALATNIPGAITSNITTDGQYTGTTGITDPIGTKVGQGTIAGSGSEANTGTRGPIIDFGGTAGFTTAPLALAQQQIADEANNTTNAQNAQLDLYRAFMLEKPNATDKEHANFLDKLGLSPEVASRATSLSGQQMKNRYFDAQYNTMTGDSAAAYNFLAGRGVNPGKSGVAQLMRPYSEAVMGIPVEKDAAGVERRPTQKFIFDQATQRMVRNPNFVPMSFNSKGERVVGISNADFSKGFAALKPAETQANFDYVSYLQANPDVQSELDRGVAAFGNKSDLAAAAYNHYTRFGKNDGRPFTMISDAKPEDKAIFEYAEANNVTNAQLAKQMGIPVAEVASRRKKFKDATKPTTTSTDGGGDVGVGDTGFGDNDTASNNAPVESMGTDTGGGGFSFADPDGMFGGAQSGDVGFAQGGKVRRMALGGLGALARGGATSQYNLGGYSDGGRLLRGPGDGVSDSIPAMIGDKQPARLADGEFVVPARIVSELGNGSTEAGARTLYTMMDRVQKARGKTTGKNRVAANTRADKFLPA